jgi:methanogenic corrinoid protein MtbC1
MVMISISDFPLEPKYPIKTVCAQTGIRAVTLRAWERRHKIMTPFRSGNGYRLYSERDVAILRWVKNRVDNGISISRTVEEFNAMELNGLWAAAIPTSPRTKATRTFQAKPIHDYINHLYQVLIHHDEMQADEHIFEIQSLFDVKTVLLKIFIPCLVEIGEAWYRGEIRVSTEHFASSYLRGKLFSLFQAYPTRRSSTFLMVGCAPTEQHELGSLILSILLRARGYRVEYLGADLPLDDLADYASYEKPKMVILSASLESAARELKYAQEKFNKLRNTPIFAFGGRAFILNPDLRKEIAGTYLGDNLDQVLENVDDICGRVSQSLPILL